MGSKTRHANPNFKSVNTSGNCIAVPCQHMRSPSSQAFLGEIAQVGYAKSYCLHLSPLEPLWTTLQRNCTATTDNYCNNGFAWLLQLSYDWVPKPTMLVISSIDSETLLGSKHRPHVPTRSGSQVHGPCARWLAGLFGATLCCALPLKLRVGSTVASKRTILLYQPFRFRLQGPW